MSARVRLRKNLARAIRRGHPWIYREALAGTPRIDDGATVLVTTADGRPLALGFWDAGSPIAVRVLATTGAGADIDPRALVASRVDAALAGRLAFVDREQTDAFRWIHGEADGLPGIHVDLYGRIASVRHDGAGARAFYADLGRRLADAAQAHGVKLEAIVERRPRGAPVALSGVVPQGELEVRENGLRFGVDVAHGQKGGLFLDQRENRAVVRSLAGGRRVLNLFGYTGAFSVYAAAGGARETTTLDIAAPAIAAARRNFERNRLPLAGARFVVGDAFAFLTASAAGGERHDVVITDPPSFAPSARARPAALRAYRRLHRLAAAVTAPGGILCAASCSSHVDRATFLRTLEDAAADAGRRFELVELRGAAPDHPVVASFPEGDYLKFAVVRL